MHNFGFELSFSEIPGEPLLEPNLLTLLEPNLLTLLELNLLTQRLSVVIVVVRFWIILLTIIFRFIVHKRQISTKTSRVKIKYCMSNTNKHRLLTSTCNFLSFLPYFRTVKTLVKV